MEHSANDVRSVLSQAQAIQAKNKSEVLVRPSWNDPVKIKPLLDYGFNSLVIPMVNNVEDAKKGCYGLSLPTKGD